MQGITKDNAMASGLWRPKKAPKEKPAVPDRSDPGIIESSQTIEDAAEQVVESSGNPREEDGANKELW